MKHKIYYYLDKADSDTVKFVELEESIISLKAITNAISATEGKQVEDLYETSEINGKKKLVVTKELGPTPWKADPWWVKFNAPGKN
jgi:hypothetical protein